MAHSYVQAHQREENAFRNFLRIHPRGGTVLIDTYDTEAAARTLVGLLPELSAQNIRPDGVRLDSGDLVLHSRQVRQILDAGGAEDIRIYASSSLDENEIRRFISSNAPIDGYGVGTHLVTSSDAPYLDMVYKLQQYAGRPRLKRSEGKATYPGKKQLYRFPQTQSGKITYRLALEGEHISGASPLLGPVIRSGKRVLPRPTLSSLRAKCIDDLIHAPHPRFSLELSNPLIQLSNQLSDQLSNQLSRKMREDLNRAA